MGVDRAVGVRRHIADMFKDRVFASGLTYNSHPVACAAALAVARGARIVRAHDVAATVDAVKVAAALLGALQGDK